MDDALLKIENVSKSYPGVKALDKVSMTIHKGEIRAFLGENGAGKSTLIKCIMGVESPDEGVISVNCDGEWKSPRNPVESKELGMFANYQHVNIAKELSIAENYFLGRVPKTKLGFVDWKKMYSDSREVVDKFGIDIDPREKISNLTVAMQEMVTISKISVNDTIRLVIFDEPTALLENDKVEILFRYIRELKSQGVSIIYISHRLEEIVEICDTVSVLKDGVYIDTKNVSEVTKDMLVSMMVGREIGDIYNISHMDPGEELLRVEHLSHKKYFKDVSFCLKAGEILGFSGLVGAGRSEVMRALFGLEKLEAGEIYIKGKKAEIRCPQDAIYQGIGFLTEDRRLDGVALPLSIETNINAASYEGISRFGVISLKQEKERAERYRERTGIKTPNIQQKVENLSGGNQQKVVISKILCAGSDVLIFDEPTVGVDVGAKQEIYKIMEELAKEGKGIILISSYLPEVMGLSDRCIVMAEGKVTGVLDRNELESVTEETMLKLASTS
ncbi:sugar ABC transporter ATP-binding protein [Candidatus Merdisoma sp. JLR.KK006]|uniref:sugar ABC transporter ATP-binding protein n=1 Tax=Candidatus Merdisoma sp. JLR.KK006 TaxID=3112626 RepID=UPI002FEF9B2F